MTEIPCSLQPDLDRKVSKKKKNKLKQTLSDPVESNSQNITINTSADSSRLTFPSAKSVVMPNVNGAPKNKKKKKKNKKNRPISDGVSATGEAETEDVAESIDSGCIPDGPPDMAELTDWQQVRADRVETVLLEENKFVSNLLQWLPVPETDSMETENTETTDVTGGVKRAKEDEDEGKPAHKRFKNKEELDELHDKLRKELEDLKNRRKKLPWDQWLKVREAKLSKKLRNVKKTDKRQKSSKKGDWNPTEADKDAKASKAKKKNKKIDPYFVPEKGANKSGGSQKPIYNNKGKLVFSKFDFSSPTSDPDTHKSKDLKQMLSQALKEKEKAKWLEHKGEKKQAANMVEERAWAGALQKAEGVKVKDNVELLKKSIKRKEATKRSSQKKWDQRIKNAEKKKEDKDATRKKNLKVRKEAKKTKKLDKMKKKGHIVPGF